MGRGYNYATCLEGALKVKEVINMTFVSIKGICKVFSVFVRIIRR